MHIAIFGKDFKPDFEPYFQKLLTMLLQQGVLATSKPLALLMNSCPQPIFASVWVAMALFWSLLYLLRTQEHHSSDSIAADWAFWRIYPAMRLKLLLTICLPVTIKLRKEFYFRYKQSKIISGSSILPSMNLLCTKRTPLP